MAHRGGYTDRRAAGRTLAHHLVHLRGQDPLVLGLPRGGVVVAAEVAAALGVGFDALGVRKIRLPQRPELALGAVTSGGLVVRNVEVLTDLGVTADQFDAAAAEAALRLHDGERRWRPAGTTPSSLAGRVVVLVDDGIATAATITAAAQAARAAAAHLVVAAAPVGPAHGLRDLQRTADEVVVPLQPSYFGAVSRWYDDFAEVTDDEVRTLLSGSGAPAGAADHAPVDGQRSR